ncbi:hypothetical protein PLICRDRAFT_35236 [Plicaturopsis crispa FD-325 SS-3]|nr:hypothetical protein PLICRDRAFT_35236 [Plicaturopsis crispa FD-325 SS-3]
MSLAAASSPLVKRVCRAMESIAPLRLAEKWDNVSLILESPVHRPNANGVLLTIDLTPAVLNEALSTPTSVIVAYHPPIFRPLPALTLANPLQSTLLRCAAAGISIYAPHTSLDAVWPHGVNDWLARAFRGGESAVFKDAVYEERAGARTLAGGSGRRVTLGTAVGVDELVADIKKHLGVANVQVAYADGTPRHITTIAICAGSGGSMLAGSDAQVYFTGEMSHHEVLAAVAAGKHVILCGHTNTERGYLPQLRDLLVQKLEEEPDSGAEAVLVSVSGADRHPLVLA